MIVANLPHQETVARIHRRIRISFWILETVSLHLRNAFFSAFFSFTQERFFRRLFKIIFVKSGWNLELPIRESTRCSIICTITMAKALSITALLSAIPKEIMSQRKRYAIEPYFMNRWTSAKIKFFIIC